MVNILSYILNEIKSQNNNGFNNDFDAIFNNMFNVVAKKICDINNLESNNSITSAIDIIGKEEIILKEYTDRYLIEGILPGITKNDIDIDYDNNIINIIVNQKKVRTSKNNNMITFFQQGSNITKSFYVPNIEHSQIKAVFHSNTLRICLMKKSNFKDEEIIIEVDNFTET